MENKTEDLIINWLYAIHDEILKTQTMIIEFQENNIKNLQDFLKKHYNQNE